MTKKRLTAFLTALTLIFTTIGGLAIPVGANTVLNPASANMTEGNWFTAGMIGGEFTISPMWYKYSNHYNANHNPEEGGGIFGFEIIVAPASGVTTGTIQFQTRFGNTLVGSNNGTFSIPLSGTNRTISWYGTSNILTSDVPFTIRSSGTVDFYVTSVTFLGNTGQKLTTSPIYAYTPTSTNPGTEKTIARSLTAGFNGKIGDWDVEAWADTRGTGTIKMDVYTDGSFNGTWGNSYNTLLRTGKKFPNNTAISSLGNISLRYDVSGFSSTHGATYMCVYGWTRNQMTEWYIVDDWKHWHPPTTTGGGYTNRGTITVDGGTYDIITAVRDQQPSIDGTKTFLQIFSIRRTTRSSGTINVSAHFNRWAEVVRNVTAGTESISFTPSASLYEVSFCIEGFGGTNPSSGGANVNNLCIKWGGATNYLCSYGGCANCGRTPTTTTTTSAATTTTPPTTTTTAATTTATGTTGTSSATTTTGGTTGTSSVTTTIGTTGTSSATTTTIGTTGTSSTATTTSGTTTTTIITEGIVVFFNQNYTGAPAITGMYVSNGRITALPAAPTRTGYNFEGWFSVPGTTGGTQLTTSTVHTENTTYYARWTEVGTTTTTGTATTIGTTGTSSPTTTTTGGTTGSSSPTTTTTAGGTTGSSSPTTTTSSATTTTPPTTTTTSATTTAATTTTIATTTTGTTGTSSATMTIGTTGTSSVTTTGGTTGTSSSTTTTGLSPKLGDVNGDDKITIADALEILKYLAGMDSLINTNPTSHKAALITGGTNPVVGDALEVLKYLAKMKSALDAYWPRS